MQDASPDEDEVAAASTDGEADSEHHSD
jgi:hypothetical protein